MKWYMKITYSLASAIIAIMLTIPSGCSQLISPTAPNVDPQNAGSAMWNPQPGDEIEPGQEVPLLNPGYWDSEDGPMIDPSGASRRIGILGGTVSLGYHSYAIPPGAVLHPRTFTLDYASENGVGVDCGPSPFQFLLPVTVVLSYRNTQYDDGDGGFDPLILHIYLVSSDGLFTLLPSIVNSNARTVTALTDHFSRYIIG